MHLADNHLSPTGLVMFPGSKKVLIGDRESSPMECVAKGTVMQQALNLSVHKLREDIVYENATIATFACDNLI